MPTPSARSEEPNERRDVLVHYTRSRHAATGGKRATWVVFLGLEKHTECATLQAATELAPCAAMHLLAEEILGNAQGHLEVLEKELEVGS